MSAAVIEQSEQLLQENESLFRLAARGWRLLPCEARGKTPLISNWPQRASSEAELILSWLRRWPRCNWAAATGRGSGIFVLDVDGELGLSGIQELCNHYGHEWTETLGVKTGRGGHLYFRWPQGTMIRNSANNLRPGLDVRGEGGYVIVPPSVHPNGHVYHWLAGGSDAPILAATDWLLGMLAVATQENPSSPGTGSDSEIPEGKRNAVLTSLAGAMRRYGSTPKGIETALFAENAARCKPPLAEREVRMIAQSISRYEPSGVGTRGRENIPASVPWPEPLHQDAFTGLAGDFVRLISPQTEADPAALLFSYLVAIGSVIGRRPHYRVGGDRHYTNLFAAIVASSSKGRKGMSWGEVRRLLSLVDGGWTRTCCVGGLSSGEGLIWAIRDPIESEERTLDAGIDDKRLLALEGELSQALQAIGRDGNTLSALVRQALG